MMTGMSFASLEGYRGNRNYIKQHGDFLRSKACWFQVRRAKKVPASWVARHGR